MMSKRKAIGSAAVLIALAGSSWLYAQRKPPKLTAIDYSEIQELYSNYAQALAGAPPSPLFVMRCGIKFRNGGGNCY